MTTEMLSEQAEESWRLINQTYAHYRELISSHTTTDSKRRISTPIELDSTQIQRQATLLRFLSITEAFSNDLLYRRIEDVMRGLDNPTGRAIWEDRYEQAISTWQNLKKAYNQWFKVENKLWTDLLELTLARNAVAHGHGRLTWKQRRGNVSAIELQLSRRSIVVQDDHIILSDNSLAEAARTCREFIEALDKAVPSIPIATQ